jgi:hypothetical protein
LVRPRIGQDGFDPRERPSQVRGRLFSAVAVALVSHHDFPNSQGRAHKVRLAPGVGISKFHRWELCVPQAFLRSIELSLRVGFCGHSSRSDLDAQPVHPAFQCRSAFCLNSNGTKVLSGEFRGRSGAPRNLRTSMSSFQLFGEPGGARNDDRR